MRVRVEVTRRPGIADPEGATVTAALTDLGYAEVIGAHFGRIIDLDLEDGDPEEAVRRVNEMCRRLLANPVVEDFAVSVLDQE